MFLPVPLHDVGAKLLPLVDSPARSQLASLLMFVQSMMSSTGGHCSCKRGHPMHVHVHAGADASGQAPAAASICGLGGAAGDRFDVRLQLGDAQVPLRVRLGKCCLSAGWLAGRNLGRLGPPLGP